MDERFVLQGATQTVRYKTGVVIPVYLPQSVNAEYGQGLLNETVRAYCEQVADPTMICLSVDGASFGAEIAEQLASVYSVTVHIAPINHGKLAAAANGVRALMARDDWAYVAIVDQDGDHFANELLNFVRVAQHIARFRGDERAMVLGQRVSRHRPMGFLRGELEELADRVLLDALMYRAATEGKPLCLEYALAGAEFPDFHSGYKLFDRSTAAHVFLGDPQQAGVSDECYYRHACEAVMVVEAIEYGAYLGTVIRTTINEQPISTFGQFNVSQLSANLIIWPCKRLEIPLVFVEQWLANHMQRLLLYTLSPDGVAELERVRRLVIQAYNADPRQEPILRPLFG